MTVPSLASGITPILAIVSALATTAGCAGARSAAPPAAPSSPDAADTFGWNLPAGFPRPRVPDDNPMRPAKVELGRYLFYDRRLSGNGSYACASCHRQELAFTDGLERAVGSTGERHARSAMSLANVAYGASLNWADPDRRTLERQMLRPMLSEDPVELGLAGRAGEVVDRLRDDPIYRRLFPLAFPGEPDPIRFDNVVRAIATFERTLISGTSPYDRLLYDDDRDALSESALRGMKLFFSDRLRCSECHAGFNFSGPVAYEGAGEVKLSFHNTGLYNVDVGGYPPEDQGLFEISRRAEHRGRFRAPTLRNIELTAPYMHDGSVATLEAVIDHYARGGRVVWDGPFAGDGRESPNRSERISGFSLTAAERVDLIAFLGSLTDQAFVTDPRHGDPFADEVEATGDPR